MNFTLTQSNINIGRVVVRSIQKHASRQAFWSMVDTFTSIQFPEVYKLTLAATKYVYKTSKSLMKLQ